MDDVRETSAWVATHSSHVLVDSSGIEKVVENIQGSIPKVEWDYEGIHYFDNGPLSVQYLFVLDAMNFCFWPGHPVGFSSNRELLLQVPNWIQVLLFPYTAWKTLPLLSSKITGRTWLVDVFFLFAPLTFFFPFFLLILSMLKDKDLNYDHLASGLKAALQNDKSAFDADRLQKYTGIFFPPAI
ncbi:hypothetical protein WN943_021562 [Citrus x changshan-huyou]